MTAATMLCPSDAIDNPCVGLNNTIESAVRSYVRTYPTTFTRAEGEILHDASGAEYLDFFAGAGALNYGHNPAVMRDALISYLQRGGVTHGLDMATEAKTAFLGAFERHILKPRGLDYRVQFCSPSGTNAVEAALKLARLSTERHGIVAFSGAFHGVSMGSLAATSNVHHKRGLYAHLQGVTHVPFPSSPFGAFDSLAYLERMVRDTHAGQEKPAAIVIETVQAEGGVYVADPKFLRELGAFCAREGILLIVDDIQVGCGRVGTFFSFEEAGITPDLVTLSKSISGYGLPMSLLLIRPDLDIWQPGQHNGTFRGNQLAFVAATQAIRTYWRDDRFARDVVAKAETLGQLLQERICGPHKFQLRGRGMIWGIDMKQAGADARISERCFERGLIVETCGRGGEVIKVLPPLTIKPENLVRGVEILREVLVETLDAA